MLIKKVSKVFRRPGVREGDPRAATWVMRSRKNRGGSGWKSLCPACRRHRHQPSTRGRLSNSAPSSNWWVFGLSSKSTEASKQGCSGPAAAVMRAALDPSGGNGPGGQWGWNWSDTDCSQKHPGRWFCSGSIFHSKETNTPKWLTFDSFPLFCLSVPATVCITFGSFPSPWKQATLQLAKRSLAVTPLILLVNRLQRTCLNGSVCTENPTSIF